MASSINGYISGIGTSSTNSDHQVISGCGSNSTMGTPTLAWLVLCGIPYHMLGNCKLWPQQIEHLKFVPSALRQRHVGSLASVGIHGWIWLGCTLLARTTALNNVKLNTSPNFFDDDPDSLQNKLIMHEAVREKSKTLPKSYCTLPVSGQCAMKNGPTCSQGIPSSWPVCLQVSLKLLLQGASTADSTPPYQLVIYLAIYSCSIFNLPVERVVFSWFFASCVVIFVTDVELTFRVLMVASLFFAGLLQLLPSPRWLWCHCCCRCGCCFILLHVAFIILFLLPLCM